MKRTVTILAVILFVMAGCVSCKQSATQDYDFITIDVTTSYPKKELILQDFMDVEYIPLETTDDFITMAHIEAIGKNVIIFRNRNRATDGKIFIYDRNGKGLRIINRLGQGVEEYSFLLGITLDEDNNEIFINDHCSGKIFVYDLFGKFKRSFSHKENNWYRLVDNFDRDNLICQTAGLEEEAKNIFLIISKQDGSITKEIEIPFKEKKSTTVQFIDEAEQRFFSTGPGNQEFIPFLDNWLLVEPSSDTIYKLLPDYNIIPFIVKTPSVKSMNPEVFLFPGVITDRYYFIQSVKKEYDFEAKKGFPRIDLMYDKQENTIFEYVMYNDDYSNRKTVNLGQKIFFVNNNIAFLQKLEASEIIEAYEKGELKGKLKEIAAGLEEESNPVIMLVKNKNSHKTI